METLEVELLVEAHLIHAAQVKLRQKISRSVNTEENEEGLLMHPIVDYITAIPLIKVNQLKTALDKDVAVWRANLNLVQSVSDPEMNRNIDELVTE